MFITSVACTALCRRHVSATHCDISHTPLAGVRICTPTKLKNSGFSGGEREWQRRDEAPERRGVCEKVSDERSGGRVQRARCSRSCEISFVISCLAPLSVDIDSAASSSAVFLAGKISPWLLSP